MGVLPLKKHEGHMPGKLGKIGKKKRLLLSVFWAMLLVLIGGAAYGDALGDVNRLFELHSKLMPGMTIAALNELLGPPASNTSLGKGDVTRYAWLHGEMGIEAYEVEGSVYRVTITLPCDNDKSFLRAMDALTRRGRETYGSLPKSDQRKNEYYWVRDGVRFAFSKYNKTTILSSCTVTR
jgi:hypothetical protein